MKPGEVPRLPVKNEEPSLPTPVAARHQLYRGDEAIFARPIAIAPQSAEPLSGFRVENEEGRVRVVIAHVDQLGVRGQRSHQAKGKAVVEYSSRS